MIEPVTLDEDDKLALAQQLVAQAKTAGIELVGPDGLLTGLTKQVLETALDEELTGHLATHPVIGRPRPGRTSATAPGPRRS